MGEGYLSELKKLGAIIMGEYAFANLQTKFFYQKNLIQTFIKLKA